MLELILAGGVEVQAAARKDKSPKLRILAYGGDVISVPGWGALIIDLSGLDLRRAVTILDAHENTLGSILGTGKARVEDGQRLIVDATLASSPAADALVGLLASGVELQASLGTRPEKTSELQPGAEITVNGRDLVIDRPTVLVEAARLEEVSILPLAADGNTTVAIAAKRAALENRQMSKDKGSATAVAPDEATMRANRIRRDGIQASMVKYRADYPDAAEFIEASGQTALSDESWTPADFENLLARETTRCQRLDASPAPSFGRGGGGAHGGVGGGEPRKVLAAAFLLHTRNEETAIKGFDANTVQAARDLRVRHCLDLCEASVRANPSMQAVPADRGELIRASFGPSTYSLPSALGLAGEKLMQETYAASPVSYRSWVGRKSVGSFRTHTAVRPFLVGGEFDEVPPSGELSHSGASEEKYEIAASTYGRMFSIDRRDLVNDDLSVFTELFAEIGRQAPRKIADLIYTKVLDNPSSFFSAGNSNYLEGANTALSVASLGLAVALLRKQKDGNGKPIGLAPAVILVPPDLEATAASIINSTTMARDQTSDMQSTGNPWAGRLSVEIEPRLSDTTFHTSASALAWFVMCSPITPLAVVAYLNGQENPTVEQIDAPTNKLGIGLRAYIDFGVALSDYRAGVRMKGEV